MKEKFLVSLCAVALLPAVLFVFESCAGVKKNSDMDGAKTSQNKSENFVLVKGGTFTGRPDFVPKKINSFVIGCTEVTQEQYEKVIGKNPSHHKGSSRPVDGVSWNDAVEYCNALSRMEGLTPCYNFKDDGSCTCDFNADGYRLPSFAEWEYAGLGGNDFWKITDVDSVAWIAENSGGETHDVASKSPNEIGLYDMLGNVSEWGWEMYFDWISAEYSHNRYPIKDLEEYELHAPMGHILCGACYAGSTEFSKPYAVCFYDAGYEHDPPYDGIGFRVVRTVKTDRR